MILQGVHNMAMSLRIGLGKGAGERAAECAMMRLVQVHTLNACAGGGYHSEQH